MEKNSTDKVAVNPTGVKKKHRLRKLIIIVLLLFALLIFVSPYLLSTDSGSGWVAGVISNYSQQEIKIQDMSLSWLGPIHLTGLKVCDDQQREILQVEKIRWSKGLLRAISRPLVFTELDIDRPAGVIYVTAEKEKEQEEPKAVTSLPEPKGKLNIQAGKLTLIRADGKSIEIEQIDSQIELNTLNDIKVNWQLALKDGGKLSGQGQISNLAPNRKLDLTSATGSLKAVSESAINIGPLVEFAADNASAGGQATINVQADFKGAQVNTDLAAEVKGLHIERAGAEEIKPIDVKITGQARGDNQQTRGQGLLSSQAGEIKAQLQYKPGKDATALDGGKMVSAIMGTGQIKMPDVIFTADGAIDVPKLVAAVPSLLKVRQDVQITQGKLTIDKIAFKGGAEASLSGSFRLTDLKALKNNQPLDFAPVSAEIDLQMEPKTGLLINQAQLNSVFAQVKVTGAAANLKGDFEADLDKLQLQLGQLIEMPATELAGNIKGRVKLTRAEDEKVMVKMDLTGRNFSYLSSKGRIDCEEMTANFAGYLGALPLPAQIDRDKNNRSFITSGKAKALNLAVDKKSLTAEPVEVAWSQVKLSSGTPDQFSASMVQLTSQPVNITAQEILCRKTEEMELNGHFEVNADLARCCQTAGLIAKMDQPPALTGQLQWTGNCRTREKNLAVQGKGQIDHLTIGTVRDLVKKPSLQFSHNIEVNQDKEQIALKQLQIDSELLTAQAQGTIGDYKSSCILDLNGWYEGSWERISAMIHELVPESAEVFTLAGTSKSKFSITGPARVAKVKPEYRGVQTTADVNFSGGEIYGLLLGQGKIAPVFKEGQINLGDFEIPAAGGKFHLKDARVDMQTTPVTLFIPGKVKILENVAIDKKLGKYFLSRINPIFANIAAVEGKVSLELTDINVPLSAQFKNTGVGVGRLDLSQMKIEPAGLLAELVQLAGQGKTGQYMSANGVNFSIRDGRISYDNFLLKITDNYEVKFYGSVGFDDKLKLMVSLPISEPLLQRLGVRTGLGGNTSLLSNLWVEVPLIGTRLQPKLNFAGVKVEPIIKALTEATIKEQTGRLLDSVLNSKKRHKKK